MVNISFWKGVKINKFHNIEVGKNGEHIACKYLANKGYNIVDKNYRTKFGEIDVIAIKNDEIIFIEVKSRNTIKFGFPAEAINNLKKNRIMRVSNIYITKNNLYNEKIRYDVIEIFSGNKINHIKNVFF